MIELSDVHYRIARNAYDLIIKRKREASIAPDISIGPCAIVTAFNNFKENNTEISGYQFIQVMRAIVIPNAKLFFLSHKVTEKDIVDKLATFIEDNSFNVTF